ncbi:MAG: hypothetical protein JW860_10410, partial [Sedimentisphaerales bacterium]|nr:hypothetical protein [Sedimentisphaerales bacterium]
LDAHGRKVELGYVQNETQALEKVFLDDLDKNELPHFIIALDGVPFQLVEELYEQGHFRLFYPPARTVSTFPAMTDLAFQRLFGGRQPIFYEATYFDRVNNRLVNGNDMYLSGEAADWSRRLDYRCSFMLDTMAYTSPQMVFEHELRGMMEVFRQAQTGTTMAYSVGTAGLGTQGGREAILRYLRTIDQFCEEIVHDRKGKVKITLLADHGHNMSGRGRVTFEKLLRDHGYRLNKKLEKPGDVVTVEYGLVTYAAYFTDDPAGVAGVLLQDPAATVACYPQNDSIVVQTIDGKAVIRHNNGSYSYTPEYGDPLRLGPIIKELKQAGQADHAGFINDKALFEATVTHIYPDPLRRIWMAFHGLVQIPADLIVCLEDGWVHGSAFFNTIIGGATSTHGSLNQINSMTFTMTMWGPLPPALRLEEVMPALSRLQQEYGDH